MGWDIGASRCRLSLFLLVRFFSLYLDDCSSSSSMSAGIRLQQHSRSTGKKRQESGHKPWCDFNTTRQHLAGWIMLVSGSGSSNRKYWMRKCRNSVLVFVQDPICAREAWNYVWSTHVFGGGAQAKKGPSEGEFFFFSCSSLSRRRVAEELSADGAPLAGGNTGCIN